MGISLPIVWRKTNLLQEVGDAIADGTAIRKRGTNLYWFGNDIGDPPSSIEGRVRILEDHLHTGLKGFSDVASRTVGEINTVELDLPDGGPTEANDEARDRRLSAT